MFVFRTIHLYWESHHYILNHPPENPIWKSHLSKSAESFTAQGSVGAYIRKDPQTSPREFNEEHVQVIQVGGIYVFSRKIN